MFTHLLAPLDGSALAEAVLPSVRALSKYPGTRVTLLHLIERDAPDSVHGQRHLTRVGEAEQYLEAIAASLRHDGIAVKVHVHTVEVGDTAGMIVDHAEDWAVDLIVLCAHGRSGLGRWLFGSIAQKVLAIGVAPVLMILPAKAGAPPPPPTFTRVLLPLDGSAEAEAALPLAQQIVRETGGILSVLFAVPTVETLTGGMSAIARFTPTASAALLDDAEGSAVAYLHDLGDRLRTGGIHVETMVVRDDPTTAIEKSAGHIRADLIVMASHGRLGMRGVWAGSVSSKVLAHTRGPFLLIRAPDTTHRPV